MIGDAAGQGLGDLTWFKSSYSAGDGGQCVEIAGGPAAVYVRDSKDKTGPVLTFDFAAWDSFVRFAAESES